ncbi:hypothetical protein VNO77_10102 [Canavalia gladiata]|uniref:Transmembrane protein n=1 Tax=Canavalia gladiata TaxID=3824 RepID=A0AAN9MFG0_CANGL
MQNTVQGKSSKQVSTQSLCINYDPTFSFLIFSDEMKMLVLNSLDNYNNFDVEWSKQKIRAIYALNTVYIQLIFLIIIIGFLKKNI